MLLRDAISRSSAGNTSSSARSSSNPAGANGGGGGSGGGGGGNPMAGGKQQMSKGQMYSEIQAMKLRITEEEKRRKEAEAEKVGRVVSRLSSVCVLLVGRRHVC